MATRTRPVHLGGAVLERSRHVCAFFNSRDEEYETLLPFITEGFNHGDKAYHIVESSWRPQHRRKLQAAGIDTAAAEARGQLDIRAWEDAYHHPRPHQALGHRTGAEFLTTLSQPHVGRTY